MPRLLIGLTGAAGAGKDTVADMITSQTAKPSLLHRYAFAEPMKEAAKILMGWGDAHVHEELKEVVDPLYGVSPRKVLQTLGTEWGRELINPDLWLLRAERYLDSISKLSLDTIVVITDVRFDNEAEFIIHQGGVVIEVLRPNSTKQVLEHKSEGGVKDIYVRHTLNNDSGLIQLKLEVLRLMGALR